MSGTTSPDNIFFPTSTDSFGPLETNFATMAASMQTALNNTKFFRTADLNSLNALSASVGGTPVGVIEGGAIFMSNGSAWIQTTSAMFASTAGRDAAYAKASSTYKTDNAVVFVAGVGQQFRYNTAFGSWRNITPGRIPMYPSSVAGTGTSLSSNKINFVNNSANLNVYGVFTDEFDLYDVTIAFQSAGTALVYTGIDDSNVIDSGNNWATVTLIGSGAAASSITSGLTTVATIVAGAAINGNIRLRVSFARSLQAGLFEFEGTVFSSPAAGNTLKGGSRRNISGKVGGLSLQFSAASSGYVIVEGVRGG